jgi:ribonucleoside-diphosphate reductase alpha chain
MTVRPSISVPGIKKSRIKIKKKREKGQMQAHGQTSDDSLDRNSDNDKENPYVTGSSKELALSENAVKVLERRYLKKDDKGKILETPRQMMQRVAKAIAVAERSYGVTGDELQGIEKKFYDMMASMDFVPNSPTLMNAGRELGQLSACFVLPVGDSIEEIFDAIKYTALIHKSGGGTGFSFSRLRPANDAVQSTKGVSSGPISFMEVFNAATETIKQGGTRRGANMGILRVDHPDILEFITSKKDQKRLTNFNISVALTDRFMKAVREKTKYDLVNPHSGLAQEQLDANQVFDLIVNMAWRNGEPGTIFIDNINRDNPTPEIGQIESTNPCGEQPLMPFESCNLGSINLSHMLRKGETGWTIDWDRLKDITVWATRFLDDVIDVNRYPLPQIEEMTKSNRKIGLGIMGFADMLIRLEVPYDSPEALEIARNLMRFIHTTSRDASQSLAKVRGSFPNFHRSTLRKKFPLMRNATVTTIAPTGTISIIAGCSSGIEPLFAIAYIRNVMDKDELSEVNQTFEATAKERGFYSKELMIKVAQHGSIAELKEIPEDVRRTFITAHDITPETHIRMQAAFQEFTDNAVSKTVNFSHSATSEDVRKVYLMAFDLGLKGVTVYRDGSRDEQVLNIGKVNRKGDEPSTLEEGAKPADKGADAAGSLRAPRPRPAVTRGATHKLETGCGKLYVTINEDEHGLCEIFTQMGKSGGCTASQSEAIGRLISLSLRSGIDVKTVIKQLKGIRCPSPLWQPGGMILSCSDAIAKALERYVESREIVQKPSGPQAVEKQNHVDKGDVCPECPECGAMVDYVEGCVVCRSCGYSRCW